MISENQPKAESYDQTDIAPFRYRQEPVRPTSPLNRISGGSIADKVGHLEPNLNSPTRKPVSIIKKTQVVTNLTIDDTKLMRTPSSIIEEGSSESLTKPTEKSESKIYQVIKQSAFPNEDLRHQSYNQAISMNQNKQTGVVRQLVENLGSSSSPQMSKNSNVNSQNLNIDIASIDDTTFEEENSFKEDYDSYTPDTPVKYNQQSSDFGIRNLVMPSQDKRSHTLPSIN